MRDLPTLGDRVAIPTTTGRAFGTVCGFGIIDRERQRRWGSGEESKLLGTLAVILIDLDREHRGEIIPPQWPYVQERPTISVSVVACTLDSIEPAERLRAEPID